MTGAHSVSNKMRQYKMTPYAAALQFMSNEIKECIPPLQVDSSGLRDAHINTIKKHTEKNCGELDMLMELDMKAIRNHIPDGPSNSVYKPKGYTKKTYR
jgi:hypothetical protein